MPAYQQFPPFVPAEMTTAQRDAAYPDPPSSLMLFNSDAMGSDPFDGRFQMYGVDEGQDEAWMTFLASSPTRLVLPNVFTSVGDEAEALTISGGSITASRTLIIVDTESGAGTDDLTAILDASGGTPDDLLILTTANPAREVVLKHGSGGTNSIFTEDDSDLPLNQAGDIVLLIRSAQGWHVIGRGALHMRQHDHADAQGGSTLDASVVKLPTIGSPTYDNVEQMNTLFHSTGWFSGGAMSDAGGATINVTAGTGAMRATDSQVAQLLLFDFPASNGLAITANSIRYIGVEYNAGSPQVVVRTSNNFDLNRDFPLGTVVNESGTLHIQNAPWEIGDHANFMIQRMRGTAPIARDKEVGGLIFSETGTRNVAVTAGQLWRGLTAFVIGALDTDPGGAADTFDGYSSQGKEDTGISAWPNTVYDDGGGGVGTLTTLGNNKWANLWFYIELDGELVMVYGTAQYNSQALAEAEAPPSTLPNRLQVHGVLAARFIFQKSAGTAAEILSAFDTPFSVLGVTDHGNLAGLGDSDHAAHFDIDGSKAMTGDLNLDGNNLDNVGVAFLKEQAEADADVAGSGQVWVNTATPNELFFTGDDGVDQPLTTPKRSAQFRAGSLTPNVTNPCADAVQTEGANGKNYVTRSFAANEQGSMEFELPANYDGGTITWWYKFITPAGSSAGDTVIFGLAAGATKDDESMDVALGARVNITYTLPNPTAAGDLAISAESAALTIASSGTAAGGDEVVFEIERTGGTMAEEAPLLKFYVRYPTNNSEDV